MTTPLAKDRNPANGAPQGTRVERALVTFLLLAMMALPAASSLSRRLWNHELPGSSQLAQHITLWVGFLGALLSTLTGRHLGLSTLDVMPAGWPRRAAAFFGQAVSAATCALLAWASVRLVQVEWHGLGRVAFGIREAWSELVMPVGFAIMALRFAWRADAGGPRSFWLRAAALLVAGAAFLLGRFAPGPFLVTVLLLLILAAFLLGAPVFVVMAGVAMALFFKRRDPHRRRPDRDLQPLQDATLPAIPLLTAAGYILAEGEAGRRLVRVYKGIFGWMPGGVAVMATVVCALFTTFTGASGRHHPGAGRAAPPHPPRGQVPGGLLGRPGDRLRVAGVALSAVAAGDPVRRGGAGLDRAHLHRAAWSPACFWSSWWPGTASGRRAGRAPRQAFHPGEALHALWDAKWDLGLPALVVLAVASGFVTVVEAAALAAAYSLMVELVVYPIDPPDAGPAAGPGARVGAGRERAHPPGKRLRPEQSGSWMPSSLRGMVGWTTQHIRSPALFLLMLNAVLLVLGSVLEMYSAIVVIAPLVAPLGARLRDRAHPPRRWCSWPTSSWGSCFPPMGLNLFLSASRFGKPLAYVYRRALPFLLIMSIGVLGITYFPLVLRFFTGR